MTSATNNKYDRQLRLWGASGQRSLGETCVTLLRATAVGTETLKNLVLPGVGSFLVIDDCTDVQSEYSSNFLVQKGAPSRAESACKLLQEMNPDVSGSFRHVDEGLGSVDLVEVYRNVTSTPGGGIQRCIIIAADLEPPLLDSVAAACEANEWPLLAVHSYGFVGVLRLQSPSRALLQPKFRDQVPDLRLVNPFPRLRTFYEELKLHEPETWKNMTNQEYSHIPYPLILLRAAQEWKERHNGKDPQTFQEKQEFAKTIDPRNTDQLNFEQAKSNAYTAYAQRELDMDHIKSLKSVDRLVPLVDALKKFLEVSGHQPPVAGTIPDMAASTDLYIRLQQVYKKQAEEDWNRMRSLVSPNAAIDEDITNFCQNVFSLDAWTTGPISAALAIAVDQDLASDLAVQAMEGEGAESPEQTPLLWLVGFLACQAFFVKHNRYPGTEDISFEEDCVQVCELCGGIVEKLGLAQVKLAKDNNWEAVAQEFTRYGNAEVHNIASILGGVASQEAVKVITGQYVPLSNTYVFNGISSAAAVYKI